MDELFEKKPAGFENDWADYREILFDGWESQLPGALES